MKRPSTFILIAAGMLALALIFLAVALFAGSGEGQAETPAPTEEITIEQQLRDENEELKQQIQELEALLEEAGVELKTATEREDAAVLAYAQMRSELDAARLETENSRQAAQVALEERTSAIEDRDRVVLIYEKLWRAMTYFDDGRYEDCKSVLDEMTYLNPEQYLSSTSDSAVIITPSAKYQQMIDYFAQ